MATADPGARLAAWLARGVDEDAAWEGLTVGPGVDEVASRLSGMPREFLDPSADPVALAGDVLHGQPALVRGAVAITAFGEHGRSALAVVLWLLASQELIGPFSAALPTARLEPALAALALRLAPIVPPAEWTVDARRREEAVRLLLLWSGVLPAGEDPASSRARWERLDSVARDSTLRTALDEQRHRLRVQRALQDKRAAEASARYSHE